MQKYSKRLGLLAAFVLVLAAGRIEAATITIDVTPSSTGSCATPDYVCSLQQALTAAESGTDDFTINLAAGTYSDAYTFSSDQNKTVTLAGAGVGQTLLDPSTNTNPSLNININSAATLNLAFSNLTITGGQGLQISSSPSSPGSISLSSVDISDNPLSAGHTSLYVNTTGSVSIANSSFSGNTISTGGNGAAAYIRCRTGALSISDSTFENNTSGDDGGALYLETTSGSISIINSLFISNSTANIGVSGAGVYATTTSGNLTLTNNTFYGNSATSTGGALFFNAGSSSVTANLYNNIFSNNSATTADDIQIDLTTTATMNVFNNNISEFCTYNGTTTCGLSQLGSNQADNTNEDPQFTNAAGNDFTLLAASTLIDAGLDSAPSLPSTDITGTSPRDFGAAPDMGAYEAIPELAVSPSSIDFSSSSSPQTVTITNNGNYAASISNIALSDSTNFSLSTSGTGACGGTSASLEAGANCTVQVSSNNQSSSTTTGSLTITSNDPANGSLTVSLSEPAGSGSSGGCALSGSPGSAPVWFAVLLAPALLFTRMRRQGSGA